VNYNKADIEAIPIVMVGNEVVTEEKEPEHFVLFTYVIPPYTAQEPGVEGSGAWYAQVLGQDPRRKSAALYFPDGPAIACHSEAQASDSSNLETGTSFPQGAYFPQGSSMAVDGTGRMWVVNPGATTIRVTIVTNRYGIG
jgi:hypothetical protein